ncbi:hypothetical protein T484DRAFT_1633535, partial [Baffinella frigidus]
TLTHTLSHCLAHPLTLSRTPSHTVSHTLSHCLAHPLTLSLTPSRSLSLSQRGLPGFGRRRLAHTRLPRRTE